MTAPLLRMAGMSVELSAGTSQVDIVCDVDLELNRGERLGIVGESGSGKSMTALAVMGLLPQRMRVRGELLFDGRNLAGLPEAEYCSYRGRRIAMIFQEPMTALNPVKSIGAQIAEGRRLHLGETRADAEKRARALLDRVGLPAPRFNLDLYPHQLSGGQRQRVMIAMAIACEPDLLIADEPTTALDVTVQAQILDLLDDLIEDTGTALMLITHDLGVVSEMTERIAVMYAGRIIETGRTDDVFARMAHPYARGLFAASPHGAALAPRQVEGRPRLNAIPGIVPDPFARPAHCSFAERCAFVQPDCQRAIPPLDLIDTDRNVEHRAACFHPRERMVAP
ncbi:MULTISPECIES: ABC transporter ATP-binding protein [unclassified Ensifer]|uniref:ABC transporter ATP-binding protein n=1 Tax=unclassified Ensifer TaxID=2633371 RepID=UPI0008134FA1|nr:MULTISPECIES: ABC transporter ATP-binding protein [unclassified Ensifer]OCP25023.1 ABC transporter [Ensifer sp. LC54]OCP25314.1 ABC transporter [Ensifer sp. LC384]